MATQKIFGPVNFQAPSSAFSVSHDASDWSCGQSRVAVHPSTGDKIYLAWNAGNNKMQLWTSQNNGPMVMMADDATNASGSQPNMIQGFGIDSAGRGHIFSRDNATVVYYYTRITFTVTDGHVRSYTIDQSAIAATDHGADGIDPRGDLIIDTFNGTERCMMIYGSDFSADTTYRIYGMVLSALSGTATLVGVTGSGSDTLLYSASSTGVFINHNIQPLLVQNKTSGRVYAVFGQLNTDYWLGGVTGTTQYDLSALELTFDGTNWAVGSTQVLCASVTGNTQPQLCSVYAVGGKSIVQYYSNSGLIFGYIDSSGTWHDNYITSPMTDSTKSAFACCWSDDTNMLFYAQFAGINGASPFGMFGWWDGSIWRLSYDAIATLEESFGRCAYASDGLYMVKHNGNSQGQTSTGHAYVQMYFYTPADNINRKAPDPRLTRQRGAPYTGIRNYTDIKEWF